MPKQFLSAQSTGRTMLQETADRMSGLIPPERTIVVTLREYVPLVKRDLPHIPDANILPEPYKRDTAPCVALAMYSILKRDPDAVMVVLPSDHSISDNGIFSDILRFVSYDIVNYDALATIGISPTRPDTNYGYIQADGVPEEGKFIKVKTFTEKPDASLAEVFVQSGDFLWNSGIFIWKADTIRREFERYMPRLVEQFRGWEGALGTPYEADFLDRAYADIEKISIDYGILERTDKAWVYPAGIGWHDLGTWESLYNFVEDKDAGANVVSGNPKMMKDSHGNLVFSCNPEKLLSVCGLDNYVVVDTGKALLVCPRDDKKLREFISTMALPQYEKYR